MEWGEQCIHFLALFFVLLPHLAFTHWRTCIGLNCAVFCFLKFSTRQPLTFFLFHWFTIFYIYSIFYILHWSVKRGKPGLSSECVGILQLCKLACLLSGNSFSISLEMKWKTLFKWQTRNAFYFQVTFFFFHWPEWLICFSVDLSLNWSVLPCS